MHWQGYANYFFILNSNNSGSSMKNATAGFYKTRAKACYFTLAIYKLM